MHYITITANFKSTWKQKIWLSQMSVLSIAFYINTISTTNKDNQTLNRTLLCP